MKTLSPLLSASCRVHTACRVARLTLQEAVEPAVLAAASELNQRASQRLPPASTPPTMSFTPGYFDDDDASDDGVATTLRPEPRRRPPPRPSPPARPLAFGAVAFPADATVLWDRATRGAVQQTTLADAAPAVVVTAACARAIIGAAAARLSLRARGADGCARRRRGDGADYFGAAATGRIAGATGRDRCSRRSRGQVGVLGHAGLPPSPRRLRAAGQGRARRRSGPSAADGRRRAESRGLRRPARRPSGYSLQADDPNVSTPQK